MGTDIQNESGALKTCESYGPHINFHIIIATSLW